MIVHGFYTWAEDAWILGHHLDCWSRFVDRIVVLSQDGSPIVDEIASKFPYVDVVHHVGKRIEGLYRQEVLRHCLTHKPEWILWADTDEIPTPDVAEWVKNLDDRIDCYYADWVNLYRDAGHALGGVNAKWSFQNTRTNKKGLATRIREGVEYRYDVSKRNHVRMEPNPLAFDRTLYDTTHVLAGMPKLVHYRYANWPRWCGMINRHEEQYRHMEDDATIVEVPPEWLWTGSAEHVLGLLRGPIAVVGNGPILGRGHEIDSHPTVIRFNNFRIGGFEQEVGSKTDLWCVNCWEDVEPRQWIGPMMTVYTFAEQRDRINRWLGMHPHMSVPSQSLTDAARAIKPSNPSTGITILHSLAKMGRQVDAYGFRGMEGGHYWNADAKMNHASEWEAIRALKGMGVAFR